jgi:DNA polymerase/3'-5' exonuclease PolX
MIRNDNIIKQFELLIDQVKYQIDTTKDKKHGFRLQQINKALTIIKKYPTVIKSEKDFNKLSDMDGIGIGTIERIKEIIKTGKLKEINIKKNDLKYEKYTDKLEQVFGIGRTKAYDLVTRHNIKSLQDLKKAHMTGKIQLTEQMMISLKHHDNYRQSIPRSEIDKYNTVIQKIGKTIDNLLMIRICGSYRRKKQVSNDIDILITHPDIYTKQQLMNSDINYLVEFVIRLTDENIILDDLTFDDYQTKYMGYGHLTNKHFTRRIDIYYTPYESYHYTLLHLTGSGNFNKKMRRLAIDLGYKLNEYGLFKGTKVFKVTSEEEIFDKLGMDYVEPVNR